MATVESPSHWTPVLQVVHVTDLHVKHMTANPAHALTGRGRVLARLAQRWLERNNAFGWDDGTQGHYPLAPESFRRFLQWWRGFDRQWRNVPVWLVDTGDRTAFGDDASIQAGQQHLKLWQKALGNCPVRSLYGNHDAWPGTLPGLLPGSITAQQARLGSMEEWNPAEWLRSPLSVAIPGSGASIELFALDSVCWSAIRNTRAVGRIDSSAMEALVARMRISNAAGTQGLRILAMHHPLAFPWEDGEVRAAGVFSAMKLLNDEKHARRLRNDKNDPKNFGPLVHLALSGHTHLAHPATGLHGDVVDVHQGLLSPWQLQLVGGSLMLNKSRRAARQMIPPGAAVAVRDHDRFVPSTVDGTNCQAQILRFSASPAHPGALQMVRVPVVSVDGSLYEPGEPDGLTLHYATP